MKTKAIIRNKAISTQSVLGSMLSGSITFSLFPQNHGTFVDVPEFPGFSPTLLKPALL